MFSQFHFEFNSFKFNSQLSDMKRACSLITNKDVNFTCEFHPALKKQNTNG